MPPKDFQRIALVDADLYAYRVGYTTNDDTEEHAKQKLTRMIGDVLMQPWCADVELVLTGPTNFRTRVATSIPYKGGRITEKPKHFLALRQHMMEMGATLTDDEEADDFVVYHYIAHPDKYVMSHVDKDLDQAEGYHFNPVKKEFYDVTANEGIRSFYTQLLVGDRVDNIECVYGIGPKKAEKIIAGFTEATDLFNAVHSTYLQNNLTLDRLIENARLLWLRREPNEALWLPPENR